jgi:protein-tyrosine-phosphatase
MELVGKVVFVCAGNTCRSPMAAAIAATRLGGVMEVVSAGIECGTGLPAARHAVTVMAERDLDLSAHRSTDISSVPRSTDDVVIAMTPALARRLADLGYERVTSWNIEDPYGRSLDVYRATAQGIEAALDRLIEERRWTTPQAT